MFGSVLDIGEIVAGMPSVGLNVAGRLTRSEAYLPVR
jgi:hypothetical protein